MSAGALAPRGYPKGRARRAARKPGGGSHAGLLAVVLTFLTGVGLLLLWGGSHYATPIAERARHPLYQMLKPSAPVGQLLGIVGTAMMLLIFLYSVRKRSKTLQKIGTQAGWLRVHIFLGFAGPVLVTFHTSGKLTGIVAIAFYAMWAIVVSGIMGRYLYAKIPRTMRGNQMSLEQIEDELAELVSLLRQSERRDLVLEGIERYLARTRQQTGGVLRSLGRVIVDDLSRPLNAVRVWRIVRQDRSLGMRRRLRVSRLVLRQQKLLNKLAVLDASKRLFSYWHVFHKPFTVITFVIVFIHVAVVSYLGYGFEW